MAGAFFSACGRILPVCVLFLLAALIFPSGIARAQERTEQCVKEVLQAVVHTSGSCLSELLRDISDEKERIQLIRKFVKPIQFLPDRTGYLYVYTLEGVVIGHGGMPELEGKNLIEHRDTRGFYDVRMAITTAKKGGGFFEHYWRKPGQSGEFRKLTYVEVLDGTGCFIGSGAYVP